MRQLWFDRPGRLDWREVDAPAILHPQDAIVRILVATACDIDPMIVSGHAPIPAPFPLGHEAIGEVVETGPGCGLKPGQRVALTYYDGCAACSRCRSGRPNRCETYSPDVRDRTWHGIGFSPVGFFSDMVRVPAADAMCLALPEGADLTHLASLGDNIGFGYEFTVPHLARTPGAEVLVMGGVGSIALFAAAFAVAGGAGRVVYHDTDRQRLDIAAAYGAEVRDGPPPARLGSFPITVDASGNTDSLICAIRSTEVEGQCSSVGGHFRPVTLPLFQMYAQGIHLYTGPGLGLPNMAHALDMILAGQVDPAPVTSGIFPLSDADRVMREPSLKPVFLSGV